MTKKIRNSFLLGLIILSAGCGTFSGKVIDQNNDPVPNAEICASYSVPAIGAIIPLFPAPVMHKWKKVRRNGKFRVIGLHGYDWRFASSPGVRKYGYEYQRKFEHDKKSDYYTIYMRKKEDPCFLIIGPDSSSTHKNLLWASNGERKQVDVDFIDVEVTRPIDKKMKYRDLSVEASHSEKDGRWKVVFSTNNQKNGLMITNSMNYVAPSGKYIKEEMLLVPSKSQYKTHYLYLKTRDPVVYSRVKITVDSWIDRAKGYSLRIYYKQWTNPTGSRLLEEDSRLDSFTYDELEKEAQKAILANQYMLKPDIPLRAKQNKERRDAERVARKKMWEERKAAQKNRSKN